MLKITNELIRVGTCAHSKHSTRNMYTPHYIFRKKQVLTFILLLLCYLANVKNILQGLDTNTFDGSNFRT
jgi:hypothetical protein